MPKMTEFFATPVDAGTFGEGRRDELARLAVNNFDRLVAALQWLLDDMHDAGETHGDTGQIFDSVEEAATALVEAGGSLSWYSAADAKAFREMEEMEKSSNFS